MFISLIICSIFNTKIKHWRHSLDFFFFPLMLCLWRPGDMNCRYAEEQSRVYSKSRAIGRFGLCEKQMKWASNYSNIKRRREETLGFTSEPLLYSWPTSWCRIGSLTACWHNCPNCSCPMTYVTQVDLVYLLIQSACNNARREFSEDQKRSLYKCLSLSFRIYLFSLWTQSKEA